MLDINFIRENLDLVKAGAKKKRLEVDLDALMAVDEKRRGLMVVVETGHARQNKVSQEIPSASAEQKEKLLAEMKLLKESLSESEKKLEEATKEWQLLMVQVPNIPDLSVPEGDS